ncbi:hypothetical protein D3C75_654590 [compost metagenome]
MVVLADATVAPQFAVAEHGDQAVAVGQLQQVGSLGAVGPGMGAVAAVLEVVAGIEGEVGRRVLVLQVQLGQFGPGIFDFAFETHFGQLAGGFVVQAAAGQAADLQQVEEQVVAALALCAPVGLRDHQQVATSGRPVEQALALRGAQLLARAEQQQAVAGGRGVVEDLRQAVGALDRDLTLAQEVLGGQVGIGLGLRRRAEIDRTPLWVKLGEDEQRQGGEQSQRGEAGPQALAGVHGVTSACARLFRPSWRQASHNSGPSSAGGGRLP